MLNSSSKASGSRLNTMFLVTGLNPLVVSIHRRGHLWRDSTPFIERASGEVGSDGV